VGIRRAKAENTRVRAACSGPPHKQIELELGTYVRMERCAVKQLSASLLWSVGLLQGYTASAF
jgi:hypothetical protein